MTDYKRAYHLPGSEWLIEERRGDLILGSDQGYWELDWKIEYPNGDRVLEYRIYNGWNNGGPDNIQFFTEEEFDDPDFMSDEWIRKNFEAIEDRDLVQRFIDSRPGMREMMGDA